MSHPGFDAHGCGTCGAPLPPQAHWCTRCGHRPHGSRRPASLLLAGTSPASAGATTTAALVDLVVLALAATPLVLAQGDLLSAGLAGALSAAAALVLVVVFVTLWWTTGRTPGAVLAKLRWVDAYAGTAPGRWRLPGRGVIAVSLAARDPKMPIPVGPLEQLDFMAPALREAPQPPPSQPVLAPAAPTDGYGPVSAVPPSRSPAPVTLAPAPPVLAPRRAPAPPPPPTPSAPPAPTRASHPSPRVAVLIAGDERVVITTTALLGRNPVPAAGTTVGTIVRVMDMSRSVSKTHAKLTWDGEVLSVEDHGSTNGTTLRRADGTAVPCPPGTPVLALPGDTLQLGDKAYFVETALAEADVSMEPTAEGRR